MNKSRCDWCGDDPLYVSYHDHEWEVPLFEDKLLFEFLILETFQAGLSWITILRKRENFRLAFDDFDYEKIAQYDAMKYEELLVNPGIIRNKLKIKSAISNAKLYMEIQKEHGSFSSYFWGFTKNKTIENNWEQMNQVPATTTLSDSISKALKKRGFKFVGSTVIYAYMQAVGMVNDHVSSCFRYQEIQSLKQ